MSAKKKTSKPSHKKAHKTNNKKDSKHVEHKTHAKKETTKKPVMNSTTKIALIVGLVVVIAVLLFGLQDKNNPIPGENTNEAEVVLDMYVMSQCPYGAQAETEAIKAVQKFNGDVAYNIHFIVDSTGTDTFRSLHGQEEVDENMRQLCIQEEYGVDVLYDYLLCFNENYQAGDSQHVTCAGKNDIDVDTIIDCVNEQGTELLKASEAKSKEVGATGSPTIYLDGKKYQSGRSEMDFARALCEKFDYEHEACQEIAKPLELAVTVLTDESCPSCDPSQIVGVSKQLFPGAKFEYVDVESAEGKTLVEEHNLVYAPAYIFDSKVIETNTWETNTQIRGAFVESNGVYRLRDESSGASWFIDEEKQEEFFASIGVTKGDNKPQIDFFIMSYCPYGNQAEEGIAPVYEMLGDKADFNPRYVIYSDYGSGYPEYCMDEENVLCSMHGIQELNQNIREACVAKYMGTQEWFDFALEMNNKCDSNNADTCWVDVAKDLGLDTGVISNCEETEGYDLMAADKELGDKLAVRGSPTIFIDGAQYSGARTAQGYLSALCAAYDDAPEECAEVIDAPAPATSAVPAGQC